MTPSQLLPALALDLNTPVDQSAHTYPEFDTAPDGYLWSQREPRRPGVYLWRYTRKWQPWFRRVVRIPGSSLLGVYSHRWQQTVPLDHLVGKGASSQWLLPNNQKQPTPTPTPTP